MTLDQGFPHLLAILSLGMACVPFDPYEYGESETTITETTGTTGSVGSTSSSITATTSAASDSSDDSTSSSGSTTTVDATTDATVDDTGTTTESRPSCNDTPPEALAFAPPILLPGVNTDANETNAWLSPDELVLWFNSDRPGGAGGNDVYRSTRDDPAAAFGPAAPLAGMNTAAQELVHSLSADGLVLYGASDGLGSMGYYDVMVSTRASVLAEFGVLAPLANINSAVSDGEPNISADGTELYFASTRAGPWGLYRAELDVGGSFGAPIAVEELTAPGVGNGNPVLSADGLTIYFSSIRDDPEWDVYAATRSTPDDVFGSPVNVADVNGGTTDLPLWLSGDGCRLLLSSTRPEGEGGYDLWIAEREP